MVDESRHDGTAIQVLLAVLRDVVKHCSQLGGYRYDMTSAGQVGRRRRAGVVAALLLALAACRPAADKANAYEALYDQLMPVKAYPAALVSIQSAVAKDESEPRRWLKLGQVLLILNQPAQAAEAFQHALDLQPDNVGALENLAVLSVRGNQYEMAKRYADPLLLIQPTSLGGLLASSMTALHEKRYDDAGKAADLLIANYPDREDGWIIKARILDASGHTRNAAALLTKRAETNPDSVEINSQLLLLFQRLGDLRGVQDTAIRLARAFPDDPRYLLESARAWQSRGRTDLANTAIAHTVARFGGNPSAMSAVANFWRTTLPPAAARDRIAGLAGQATTPAVKSNLAATLIDMGDPVRAAALLAPIAAGPVASANVDLQGCYARALLAAGRTGEAEAKIRAILAFDGSNPEGLLLRAQMELAHKNYNDALTDAQLVASDDGENEQAALLIARIYGARGDKTLAANAFADARNSFPHSIVALRAEVDWLMSQHQTADALAHVADFASTHPRRSDGWALYAELCAAAGDATCRAKAQRAPRGRA
ncbi:tetratricopeptide repeat protein [Sphingomonas nostoxanthinifaciens]|uniref:tetratricopeptide repeat protein n=1 Tax=Sphingomonas nostoxanthinifaciens TaxID=2872652 RepID=UPI001CC204AC|nr:tetratricopeptide repeat protein [Sphingomonas nostoxanthinifaciens]UAK24140.1 tetratricopeptide repeat protein [Sphingomonas nostoxanthinifaciens]